MKTLNTNMHSKLLLCFIAAFTLLIACNEEDGTKISNDLRILTATANGNDLTEGIEVGNEDLIIEMVFSHTLNTTAFESALAISATDYAVSYDETSSFVTITFPSLDFETSYSLSLPAGDYGAQGESLLEDYSVNFVTSAFVPSNVSLSAETSGLLEGETTTITATLNEATIDDVTVSLSFAGSATPDADYTVSATSIVIPEGSTSASVTLSAANDAEIEGEESIVISIGEIVNAEENGDQQLSISLNDERPALAIKGVMALLWDGSGTNGGKAVHLIATEDIADLSVFGLGVANNGGGTDGLEFALPAVAANAGDDILIAREPATLEAYFAASCYASFEHVFQTDEMSQNGDDAIELIKGTAVIETYGDANVDGTDQAWEYTGSWAYKLGDTWTTGFVNCGEGSTSTLGSDCVYPLCDSPLALKGVLALLWDGSGTNGGKAVHLLANQDIADLSQYGIGVANNGGGTDGLEYSLPALAVSEGDHILLAREVNTISGYFGSCFDGFDHVLETEAMNQNGNDAIELFDGETVIETLGDANTDGTGQFWDYAGSWAYKMASKWTYGGVDCAAASTTTQSSGCPYSFCE